MKLVISNTIRHFEDLTPGDVFYFNSSDRKELCLAIKVNETMVLRNGYGDNIKGVIYIKITCIHDSHLYSPFAFTTFRADPKEEITILGKIGVEK